MSVKVITHVSKGPSNQNVEVGYPDAGAIRVVDGHLVIDHRPAGVWVPAAIYAPGHWEAAEVTEV